MTERIDPWSGPRRGSPRSRLARAGFAELDRARACLADPALDHWLPAAGGSQGSPGPDGRLGPAGPGSRGGPHFDPSRSRLVEELAATADPDLALLTLVRLAGAVHGVGGGPRRVLGELLASLACGSPPGPPEPVGGQAQGEAEDEEPDTTSDRTSEQVPLTHLRRLLAVLGSSRALGDFLVSHPECLDSLSPLRAVDAPGEPTIAHALGRAASLALAREGEVPVRRAAEEATAAVRVAYRERLLAVAADDLTSDDPAAHMVIVGERMTQLADAAIEAGLQIARAVVGPAARRTALAVIAMGKAGARELNYVSDVDVVYVVGPARGAQVPEDELVAVGSELASELARVTSATALEPPLWPLDTALRPEGKDGALVRTLASHLAYYERWASSWEFQALLKARACAGDRDLGAAYEEGISPFIWSASTRENFVDDARAMRRRVENESRRLGADDRRIKLGPGGLRDVEFTVQLLQLVHGRGDERLHVRSTLDGLEELTTGGYVSRSAAGVLGDCYRTLRLLEHRCQLYGLRRTHELPSAPEALRRIGRGIDRHTLGDPEALWATFTAVRRQVRALHEEIYYRPVLTAAAALTDEEMTLSPEAARARLAAVGYLDPDGAMHHIQALTEGVSRRAAIQRQLLPVIIGWLGQGPDPDNGLLSFRRLSESIGGSHWYLGMLRDSSSAARRLCQVLSGAPWTSDLVAELPESVTWLDDDAELVPRPAQALRSEVEHVLSRRALDAPDPGGLEEQAVEAVRAVARVRTRELIRAALADSLDGIDPVRTARMLTDATDAVLGGALEVALALVVAQRDGAPAVPGAVAGATARHAVVAMGRLGGEEVTYASDADVLFVHEPVRGADPDSAAAEAESVARWTVRLLVQARPHALDVDADLRPEGRQGPMSRSLASYARYYRRWGAVWERQALLRARPCAGDEDLGRAFTTLIDPLRWSSQGLDDAGVREIRRLKARMEAERLPRGTDPAHHLKLGPGGLSDVEWCAQLLQLAHAATVPALRSTSTVEVLEAAAGEGLMSADDAGRLVAAWVLASRVRAANVLSTGRDRGAKVDVLPSRLREIRLVGRLLGMEPGRERDLEDVYRRTARHARNVAERVLFGEERAEAPGGRAIGTPAPPSPAGTRSAGPQGAPGSSRADRSAGARPPVGAPGASRGGQAPHRAGSSAPTRPPRRGPRPQAPGPYPWS
ncbi:bifunctional [glutamine synthetase] adenylyltransferase/[glutamine synthetase]-adenylyl-L-tyrosine phosphorylase [Actinomyces howellii]|uniref:bifunctional [glutamine synthetase] adenylyltransferase/[glutamine synthetase]-adenylyl-L-tyrosine phosphorylase n=1 Tax=Actinomyces howellii TaxID=52771 RepID=UPI000F83D1BD|nr:bifunctional [glutamine synthetase] adenylyltransferase/[glutamine synthetase]-adenylyl-L-tyrosine phosphorylase [Actinomyces howellii]